MKLESIKGSSSSQGIHVSAKHDYPQAEILPLPVNIDPSESMRFSPQRARDISSTTISTNIWNQRVIDITVDSSNYDIKSDSDPHVNSYDCTGAVSLNSSMQSNVPSPFGGMHKFTHLNMPGGQWSQSSKWMSHDLHSSHYTNLRREVRQNMWQDEIKNLVPGENTTNEQGIVLKNEYLHGFASSSSSSLHPNSLSMLMKTSFACLTQTPYHLNSTSYQNARRMFSDKKDVAKAAEKQSEKNQNIEQSGNATEETVALTPRAKLKNAVRDYGSTVIIFHVAISLVSLGIFYQLVSRLVCLIGFKLKINLHRFNASRQQCCGNCIIRLHRIYVHHRIT